MIRNQGRRRGAGGGGLFVLLGLLRSCCCFLHSKRGGSGLPGSMTWWVAGLSLTNAAKKRNCASSPQRRAVDGDIALFFRDLYPRVRNSNRVRTRSRSRMRQSRRWARPPVGRGLVRSRRGGFRLFKRAEWAALNCGSPCARCSAFFRRGLCRRRRRQEMLRRTAQTPAP